MKRILFVCLGNICRSPMAEAVLRNKLKQRSLTGLAAVDSAGTGDWHIGDPPHQGTREILQKHRISFQGIHARQVHLNDFDQFDWLIAMDSRNQTDLMEQAAQQPARTEKILRFMDLVPDTADQDVPDPYYTGNFENVFQLVDKGTDKLIERLIAGSL